MKTTSRDIIILHMCSIHDNHMNDVWFMRYGVHWTEFVILDVFFATNNPENQYTCTINDNHMMMYGF